MSIEALYLKQLLNADIFSSRQIVNGVSKHYLLQCAKLHDTQFLTMYNLISLCYTFYTLHLMIVLSEQKIIQCSFLMPRGSQARSQQMKQTRLM